MPLCSKLESLPLKLYFQLWKDASLLDHVCAAESFDVELPKCDQIFSVLYSIHVTNKFLKLHLPKWSICIKTDSIKTIWKLLLLIAWNLWVKHYGVCDLCGKKCKFLHRISLKSLSLGIILNFIWIQALITTLHWKSASFRQLELTYIGIRQRGSEFRSVISTLSTEYSRRRNIGSFSVA